MKNTGIGWVRFFIGFGLLTILSGIYLILQKDYIVGIAGSVVGVFIVFLNTHQIKDKNSK